MDRSITIAGALLIIGTFMILVLYFVMSSPMEYMFDAFDDIDSGEATDEMNEFLPDIRIAMNIGWAIALITPSMIFIFWIYQREPDWYRPSKRL